MKELKKEELKADCYYWYKSSTTEIPVPVIILSDFSDMWVEFIGDECYYPLNRLIEHNAKFYGPIKTPILFRQELI